VKKGGGRGSQERPALLDRKVQQGENGAYKRGGKREKARARGQKERKSLKGQTIEKEGKKAVRMPGQSLGLHEGRWLKLGGSLLILRLGKGEAKAGRKKRRLQRKGLVLPTRWGEQTAVQPGGKMNILLGERKRSGFEVGRRM